MTDNLGIFVCQHFRPEIEACIESQDWQDVSLSVFPGRCGAPEIRWDEIAGRAADSATAARVFGSACVANLPPDSAQFPDTGIIHLEQCFHLLAGRQLVDEALSRGAYLVSPGWLRNWRQHISGMGFPPGQDGKFFREFASELLLLDTGVDPQAESNLEEMQKTLGLPARRIPIGLDHTCMMIKQEVLEWHLRDAHSRLVESEKNHRAERANDLSSMDMLAHLAKSEDEVSAIQEIRELFQMLFAPSRLHYLRIDKGVVSPSEDIPEGIGCMLRELDADYAWTENKRGFCLNLRSGSQVMGRLAMEDFAFPGHAQRYLNLSLAISGVCGLVIENVRNRKKILEAEKMASLGIVVAGVAHEINTPLGIGIATVSSMKHLTDQLSQKFAEHSMTQSDLQNHLDHQGEGCRLLTSNLEKISLLVERFRQIAVNESLSAAAHACDINGCLDDVILSLGDRFTRNRVQLHVKAEPGLQVNSQTSDWASIFTNLLDNSLKHGFAGLEAGNIHLQLSKQGNALKLVYSDDGTGMDRETLAKIFDPFFSTDLQHGMGLGMHLVYNLVTHRLNGSIQCDSQPGQGMTAYIEVPL